MTTRRTFAALLVAVAASLSLPHVAACGQASEDLKTLKGSVKVDGSSTVYPLTEAVAEDFRKKAPGIRVTIGVSGTGGGFKRFIAGETDISNASRPIRKSETDVAAKNGIEFIELPVAYDGLSVVVNPKNTWAKSLTVAQLKRIYGAENPAKTWKDLDPSWPDRPIRVFSPGTDSGTFDYFREVVIGKDGNVRSDMAVSEDDNVLVTGVRGDENAIGYFGCAYYFENRDKVRAVPIVPTKGGEAVYPTPETITSGVYEPLSRPLYIYVNAKSAERPEVQEFVRFYLEQGGDLADEVGYVHLPAELYSRARSNMAARRTGSQVTDEHGDTKPGALPAIYQ